MAQIAAYCQNCGRSIPEVQLSSCEDSSSGEEFPGVSKRPKQGQSIAPETAYPVPFGRLHSVWDSSLKPETPVFGSSDMSADRDAGRFLTLAESLAFPLCASCKGYLESWLQDEVQAREQVADVAARQVQQMENVSNGPRASNGNHLVMLSGGKICLATVASPSGAVCRTIDELENEAAMQEARLRKSLASLKKKEDRLKAEEMRLDEDEQSYLDMEDRYWYERAEFEVSHAEYLSQGSASHVHDTTMQEQVKFITEARVMSDTFRIDLDKIAGSISNLRFGRSSETPVPWPEFNAACGQIALLLHVLGKRLSRLGFEFQLYRPVPIGSTSVFVSQKDEKAAHDFFVSGDSTFSWLLSSRGFNNAIASSLSCIKEVADFVSAKIKQDFALPYVIEGDRIDKSSIRLNFSQPERWTATLKKILSCLQAVMHEALLSTRPRIGTSVLTECDCKDTSIYVEVAWIDQVWCLGCALLLTQVDFHASKKL